MIRNYFKMAWRNLRRYPVISFINIFGLTVGIACCILISAYIVRELSYDKYHKNADNIYRLNRTFRNQEGAVSLRLAAVAPPFGHYMPGEFPEIQKMTRMLPLNFTPMMYQEKRFNEGKIYVADEHLFEVFDVEVKRGNPASALRDPYSIMLTEEMAKKYFGNEDPMDKAIRFNNLFDFKVTGIYQSFPSNSHVRPEMLLSFTTLRDTLVYGEEGLRTNWGNNAFLTYFVLPSGVDITKMEARFPAFLDKHMQASYAPMLPSKMTSLHLQKLTDIHLRSNLDDEAGLNGDIRRVYIFSAVALFILLIACINYMNLSTARSALRAREIGIRKVVGAQKKELITQFLSESVLFCWISTLLAFGLAFLILPWISRVTGQELSLSWILRPEIILLFLATPFVLGLLAGVYPALFLSSFQPVKTLKGLFKAAGSNISFRKVLVVSQFSISIILIITTIIVFQQLKYIQSKSLGYDRDKVITMGVSNEMVENMEAFRTELTNNAIVKTMSRSSRVPTGRLLDNTGAATQSGDSMRPVTIDIKYIFTDFDFADTYGLEMASGRYFSRDFGNDSASFVLNEKAITALGWKADDAIGRPFQYGSRKGQVIGVVKDFHFESLHQDIIPMVFWMPLNNQGGGRLSIKIAGNDIRGSLASLESVWKKHFPSTPFEYTFVDENYQRLYEAETRQASLFSFFSAVAILIACLGLFGLSAFSISQRIKEIGVRKVLGASVKQIVVLLSTDFLKLVLIAALIAFPLAWLAMSNWLDNFAYRIGIAWWVFIVAAILAALIALLTISYLAIRAALSNPVKSLRTE